MAKIKGTSKGEKLNGTGSSDVITGLAGNDKIFGKNGNDKIDGGSGNDSIDGGTGNDNLKGGSGNDTLKGGAGNDTLAGGAGTDTAVYVGASTSYTVTKTASGFTVTGSEGTDILLSDIEAVRFSDRTFTAADITPPVADDEAVNATEDTVLDNINVLTGDTSTIAALTAANIFSFTQAANGTVTKNVNGTFKYTPNKNFSGTDNFTYTIKDAIGQTDTATVTITIDSVTDLTASDDTASGDEDTVINGNVSTNDSTTSGGTLTYAVATGPTKGGVVLNANGTFAYTPTANANGADSFTYTVTDASSGESATKTVSLTVHAVNDTPVAVTDMGAGNEGANISGNVLTNDTDVDAGATKTVSQVNGVGGNVGNQITLTSGALVTVNADGSYAYNSNGAFASLANGVTAPDSFTYQVSDGKGGSATATVNLTITGQSKSFNLTTSADTAPTFTGTGGNDTYTGSINTDVLFLSTFNSSDNLDGAGGPQDVLNVSIAGASKGPDTTVNGTKISNIEKVSIQNVQVGADVELNAALWNGATTIESSASAAGSFTFVSSLNKSVTAEMTSNEGDLKIDYSGAVLSGLADVQNLTLLNNLGGTFTVGDGVGDIAETLNVASNTADNTLNLNAANNHTTINVTGDKSLDLQLNGMTSLTKLDASGMTGGGLFTGGLSDGPITIVGSAQDDAFGFGVFDGYKVANVINGGGGFDLIGLQQGGEITDAGFAGVTFVEGVGAGNNILNLTLDTNAKAAGITTVQAFGDSAVLLNVEAGFTGPLSVELNAKDAGEPDTVDGLDLVDASASAAAITISDLASHINIGDVLTGGTSTGDTLILTANTDPTDLTNVSGFETITVKAGTPATSNVSIITADGTVAAGKSLTVDASLLTNISASLTFNGSAELDGKFNVTGGAGNDNLTGGAGADSLNGGEGADELYGGLGNDTLTGGGGADYINAGVGGGPIYGDETVTGDAGDDVIAFDGSELTDQDSVNGGTNTAAGDTLVIADGGTVVDADFTKVSGIEVLSSVYTNKSFDAALNATLGSKAAAAGIRTVNTGTNSADVISIESGFNFALTVNLQGGNDTVTSASASALTINAKANDISAADTLTGGTGTGDTLRLTADGGTADLTNVSGFETVTVAAGTPATSTISIVTADGTVAATKTLTVSAAALTDSKASLTFDGDSESDGTFSITGGAGNDDITGGKGADTIDGGAGDDRIVGGAGVDKLTGGLGDDTFETQSADLTTDTIDGGGNTAKGDTLKIMDGASSTLTDAQFVNISNVENLTFNGTGPTDVTLGTNAYRGGAGIRSVTGTGLVDTLTIAAAFAGGLTVDISESGAGTGGIDSVSASGSAATLTVIANAGDITSDTLTGGTGTGDTLKLTADTGTASLTNVTGFENITVSAGGTASDTITITTADATITGTNTLTINAAALTDKNAALTVNGAAETAGKFIITSGAGNDKITTSSGDDTIVGGNGDNTIVAGDGNNSVTTGTGNDSITTGTGNDTIVGGDGTNTIIAGDGLNNVTTGTGNDSITTGTGNDTIVGGDGVNTIDAGNGTNTVTTGKDGDQITTGTGNDTVNAGAGDDTIVGSDGANTLNGEAGNDSITGGTGADTVDGGTENDIIVTFGAADSITGGAGNDTINGGAGNDTISGGDGSDTIRVVGNGSITAAPYDAALGTADVAASGLDTIDLGLFAGATDIDTLIFDLDAAPGGVSIISNFDAALVGTSEDKFVVETSSTWANGGAGEVRQNGGSAANVSIVFLDNTPGGFSGLVDAVAAADGLQSGASSGQSYLFVWNETVANGGRVHVSYATVDNSGDSAVDSPTDLGILNGVSIANLNITDFDFIV